MWGPFGGSGALLTRAPESSLPALGDTTRQTSPRSAAGKPDPRDPSSWTSASSVTASVVCCQSSPRGPRRDLTPHPAQTRDTSSSLDSKKSGWLASTGTG